MTNVHQAITWLKSNPKLAAATLAVLLLLSFVGLVAFRSVVRVKGMVDNGSLGVEWLAAAQRGRDDTSITVAAGHFARLNQSLDHWSWIIAVSNAVPPVRRQFESMDRIGAAGEVLVWVTARSGGGSDSSEIEDDDIDRLCEAVQRLETADRRVYFQLNRTVDQLIESADAFEDLECENGSSRN